MIRKTLNAFSSKLSFSHWRPRYFKIYLADWIEISLASSLYIAIACTRIKMNIFPIYLGGEDQRKIDSSTSKCSGAFSYRLSSFILVAIVVKLILIKYFLVFLSSTGRISRNTNVARRFFFNKAITSEALQYHQASLLVFLWDCKCHQDEEIYLCAKCWRRRIIPLFKNVKKGSKGTRSIAEYLF